MTQASENLNAALTLVKSAAELIIHEHHHDRCNNEVRELTDEIVKYLKSLIVISEGHKERT
jgi:hypothetical protein